MEGNGRLGEEREIERIWSAQYQSSKSSSCGLWCLNLMSGIEGVDAMGRRGDGRKMCAMRR